MIHKITTKAVNIYQQSPFLQNNLPYILVTLANITWPLGWIYFNQHNFNFAQASICRGFSTLFLNFLIALVLDIPLDYKKPKNFKLLIIRNSIMSIHGFMLSLSQYFLPLPIVHTIAMSGISWTFVIDYIKNGVKINKKQFIGIILSFLGVIIVSNGRQIYAWMDQSFVYQSQFNYQSENMFVITMVALLLAFVMFIWAFGIVLTKQIIGVNTIQINFHLGYSLILTGTFVYPFLQTQTTPLQFFWSLPYTVIFLGIGQIMFIGALTISKNSGMLSLSLFVAVIVSQIVSIFRYHQSSNPIIIIGILIVMYGMTKCVINKQK